LDRLLPCDGRHLSPRLSLLAARDHPPRLGDPFSGDTVSTPAPDPAVPVDGPPEQRRGISADWAAVIVAAVLVLLAVLHLLPSIPFLVK
jgi:hypothetical protein